MDLEAETIRWRAENGKTGYEHVTPLSGAAQSALEFARTRNPGLGEAPLLPAPKDSKSVVGRYRIRDWWERAERKAKLEPKPGPGWHSARRKFATDLIGEPLSVLCRLGGWRDTETVLRCYQRPDEDDLKAALERRSGLEGPELTRSGAWKSI